MVEVQEWTLDAREGMFEEWTAVASKEYAVAEDGNGAYKFTSTWQESELSRHDREPFEVEG